MTRLDLLKKINRSTALKVWDRINIQKILKYTDGKNFYADMDRQFLEDIRYMTGTVNGIVMTDEDIGFILDVSDSKTTFVSPTTRKSTQVSPLSFITLKFVRVTGKCSGFYYPTYSRDSIEEVKPNEEASIEEVENSIKQIIPVLNRFLGRARTKYYTL